jgi:hypothetical protein
MIKPPSSQDISHLRRRIITLALVGLSLPLMVIIIAYIIFLT